MGAKQSKLDKLHELYTDHLIRQMKDPEEQPTASLLAVIGNFLSRSGVKATNDSPAMTTLRTAYDSLPFRTNADGSEIKAN
jgi:hypothetical protein